jgi:hypothetical protein
MKIPEGLTEQKILDAVRRSLDLLAPQFAFGPYGVEDIEQEGYRIVLEVLDRGGYDSSRPFENFIYVHLKNRLINFRRDRYRRADAPCRRCHAGDFCTGAREPCPRYAAWAARNEAKANLLRPMSFDPCCDEVHRQCPPAAEDATLRDALAKVDRELPVGLRESYLRMRAGVSLPKARRDEVEAAVRGILGWESSGG